MGLDARGISTALKKHWFPGQTRPASLKALKTAAGRWAAANQLGPLFQLRMASDTSVEIDLIGIADPIQLTIEQDRLVQDQIRHSYARALAGKAVIPVEVEDAYQEYLTCQSASDPPAEVGIGYRKYPVWQQPFKHWALSLPGYLSSSDDDGSVSFEHPAFWLGLSSFSVATKAEDAGPFAWPERFGGPMIDIRPGILCRKSAREFGDGTSVQAAMIWTSRGNIHELLLLTLSSGLDWPFDAFDRWIMSVSIPDVPQSTQDARSLH